MTEDEEKSKLHMSANARSKGDSSHVDGSKPKPSLVIKNAAKERNDLAAEVARGASTIQPRPPSLPPLTRFKSIPLEETVRARRLKNSQESLSDRVETESSTDSLKDEPAAAAVFTITGLSTASDDFEDPGVRPLSARSRSLSTQGRDSSLSFCDARMHSQASDHEDYKESSTKPLLSPGKPSGPLPPVEKSLASATLRTANRIDRDCLDYSTPARGKFRERIHRNLSDSRLLENMGSDSSSVSSLRSVYSVLSPIRPKDMRNRSFLEGSILGSGALLGTEELDRYFPNRRLGVYIVTWNMQGGKIAPGNLNDLLLPTDSEFAQDFYVVGVQEGCPDKREWDICLQETLGPHYVMLYTASHGVLYLTVFTRRDLIWFCSEVEHSTVTTRIISQIKTKGALGIAFTFFGTSFLFITSHFTSGDAKVYERILDYDKIIEALALPKSLPDTNPYRSEASDVTTRFDQVFWFGDFNFRLSTDRADVESIMSRTAGDDMSALLEHDQLSMELRDGSIFKGFQEAPIHFFPTYKFDIGCDKYDTTSKQRTPSYTDRILFKNRKSEDIKVIKYSSCSSVKTSDHRPVVGVFQVKLRPGRDNIPLCGGQFDRSLYLEGIKRRMAARELMKAKETMSGHSSSSTICTIS